MFVNGCVDPKEGASTMLRIWLDPGMLGRVGVGIIAWSVVFLGSNHLVPQKREPCEFGRESSERNDIGWPP